MEQDFDIDLREETVEGEDAVRLPLNFLSLGQIENDDVKVYIRQDVYKALEKLAASDTSRELGSILLGSYSQVHGKTHVIISQYIEAKYTDASAATLTFTHETWEYIHREHEKKYPELKIIGWQHTHPNYGIFLSNYDMFIQENFFNLPFQIAYVIDPIQNLRGFFQWKGQRVEKLKGYYIYDQVGKTVKIEPPKEKKKKQEPNKKTAGLTVALMGAVMLALAVSLLVFVGKYQSQQQLLQAAQTVTADLQTQLGQQQERLQAQDTVIEDQSQAITRLQQLLEAEKLDAAGESAVASLLELVQNRDLKLQDSDALVAMLETLLTAAPEGATVTFVPYTVAAGDDLYSICKAHGLDYEANAKVILGLNGIRDANCIDIGQTILLPITKGK